MGKFWIWMNEENYYFSHSGGKRYYGCKNCGFTSISNQMLIGYMIEYCFEFQIHIIIANKFSENKFQDVYDYLKGRIEFFEN